MKPTTKTALAALCAADDTISEERAKAALRLLDGDETARPFQRVIRTTEVARLFGVTTKTLREWAKAGALVSVYAGKNKLRTGYTEASVRALLAGQAKGGAA